MNFLSRKGVLDCSKRPHYFILTGVFILSLVACMLSLSRNLSTCENLCFLCMWRKKRFPDLLQQQRDLFYVLHESSMSPEPSSPPFLSVIRLFQLLHQRLMLQLPAVRIVHHHFNGVAGKGLYGFYIPAAEPVEKRCGRMSQLVKLQIG